MDFNPSAWSDGTMSAGALKVRLNMPKALAGNQLHELPPYAVRRAFAVDDYPACPKEWMRSRGKLASYFVPVTDGHGIWLDFNDSDHAYHLAVVVSVQGVNAITGLPCGAPRLEQYAEKCPKHGAPFGHARFCATCGFRWPKQNYVCTTGTPRGLFWLDGFRAADGVVRQYLMTASARRGVAASILGEERVFAVGVSLFLSKEPRPPEQLSTGLVYAPYIPKMLGGDIFGGLKSQTWVTAISSDTVADQAAYTGKVDSTARSVDVETSCVDLGVNGMVEHALVKTHQTSPRLEIAAGAQIRQQVYDDPMELDFWRTESASTLVVNYALEAQVEEIVAAGKLSEDPGSFLRQCQVGNP